MGQGIALKECTLGQFLCSHNQLNIIYIKMCGIKLEMLLLSFQIMSFMTITHKLSLISWHCNTYTVCCAIYISVTGEEINIFKYFWHVMQLLTRFNL